MPSNVVKGDQVAQRSMSMRTSGWVTYRARAARVPAMTPMIGLCPEAFRIAGGDARESAAISCSVVTPAEHGGSFHLRRSQRCRECVTITDSRKVLPGIIAPCAPSCSSSGARGLAVEEGRRPVAVDDVADA
jgi:hypothetical protein